MKVAEGSLASGEAAAPAAAARRSTSRLTFALAAFAGAAASLATERGAWAWLRARDAAAGASVRVGPSRAASALGELSAAEVRRVATWATTAKGFLAVRGGDDFESPWLSGPSAVELFAPPKQEALAYLDGRTDVAPPRYARITAAVPREHAAVEYKIGPLQSAEADWTMEELERVPFTKRPTEPGADLRLAGPLLEAELAALGAELLEATFGPVFPAFDTHDPREGAAAPMMQNDPLSPKGTRRDLYGYSWTPPKQKTRRNVEATWVHPMPLKLRVDSTEPDAADWTIVELGFCGRWFDSSAALKAAYPAGDASCGFSRATGDFLWEAPSRESPRQARRAVSQDHGVSWGNWSFAVFSRSSQGPALSDVRFADERVLYELSLQDALAAYSGDRKDAFFYSDAAWSLSMLSASLEPGVDCPESATFVEATNWYAFEGRGGTAVADATKAFSFYPTCVFEWTEDHTIWRHMENSEKPTVRGLARKTLVVRSIATVGNYDYITDVKLREDGEIEVGVRFAGYLETRHLGANNRDAEAAYSTALHGDLGGPVHSHVACFKVDVDVGGATANALRVTTVGTDATGFNKALATRDVETERTFTSDPKAPTNWRVVDRASTSESGLARGYAIALGSWASTEVLPADHPFVVAMPYAKWHLAVTKFKDGERRPTNPYVQYDGFDDDFGSQNLANYLDGEAILDEDLVAWVSAGKEHVTRQEDLPLVSNFGVAFSLVPWNFFATNPAAA